jgi:hypothetical protein
MTRPKSRSRGSSKAGRKKKAPPGGRLRSAVRKGCFGTTGLLVVVAVLIGFVVRWLLPPVPVDLTFAQMQALAKPMAPILDLLGEAEGDYHSVNRGRAGDSPGDWARANLGRSITDMTLAELRGHQAGADPSCWFNGTRGAAGLYAVGRYQLIPCTLHGALRRVDGLTLDHRYDPTTQDGLAVYLLLIKRPRLGAWLLGYRHGYALAGQELAKEFASVPVQMRHRHCARGQSYYCGDSAGNAALISLEAVEKALHETRHRLTTDPEAQEVLLEVEGWRGRLRRWAKARVDDAVKRIIDAGEPETGG